MTDINAQIEWLDKEIHDAGVQTFYAKKLAAIRATLTAHRDALTARSEDVETVRDALEAYKALQVSPNVPNPEHLSCKGLAALLRIASAVASHETQSVSDKPDSIAQDRHKEAFDAMKEALKKAVADYGKPGGNMTLTPEDRDAIRRLNEIGLAVVPRLATIEQLSAGQKAWLADPERRSSKLYEAMLSAGEVRTDD